MALASLAALALLGGCASKSPPDWQVNAKTSLERATMAYLSGNHAVEAVEFARARADLARSGKPEVVVRAELVRCATRVASLVFEPCTGYTALAADAAPADQAYARYLAGETTAEDAALLPPQHRDVVSGKASAATLASLPDPLSTLVAAGVMMRRGGVAPPIAQVATESASSQGWTRPLLAWLKVQQQQAEAAGDAGAVARLQRRMDVLMSPAARGAADEPKAK